ncbi:MAG: response regulator, partial [Bacteroidetes bacterium]
MKDLIKCFLIDDDEDDFEIFRMALSEIDESIHVDYAYNGIEALRKLNEDKTLKPNYFFVDLNMPRMNGKQCLEAIRKDDQLKEVPVYIYSTFADPKTVAELLDLG